MSHLPSTTAGVRYVQQLEFEDANPGIQIWLIEVRFDGPALGGQTEIRFPGSATAAQKRAAARSIVNALLRADEPVTALLTDAAIQISGQPV